jgi:hypothetical protein
MNPITTHYLAQLHMEDLHRDAEQHRLVGQARPGVSTATKIRNAAGSALISIGERLLSHPNTQTASSYH